MRRVRPFAIALAVVGGAALLASIGYALLHDEPATAPMYRLSQVKAHAEGTTIQALVDDSCSGRADLVIVRQNGDEVVVSSERKSNRFYACADGGSSTGIAELDNDLGNRALIVEQPYPAESRPVLECLIDAQATSQCKERIWEDA